MTERFTKETWIRGEAAAYVECERCGGTGEHYQNDCDAGGDIVNTYMVHCQACQGAGGKWAQILIDEGCHHSGIPFSMYNGTVTKSTILYRYHKPCVECEGEKKHACMMPVFKKGQEGCLTCDGSGFIPCKSCLVNGQSTGCEPGSATDWRVKDEEKH